MQRANINIPQQANVQPDQQCYEIAFRPPLGSVIKDLEMAFPYGKIIYEKKYYGCYPNDATLWISRKNIFSFQNEGDHILATARMAVNITVTISHEDVVHIGSSDYPIKGDFTLVLRVALVNNSFNITIVNLAVVAPDKYGINKYHQSIQNSIKEVVKKAEDFFNNKHKSNANVGGHAGGNAYGGLCYLGYPAHTFLS